MWNGETRATTTQTLVRQCTTDDWITRRRIVIYSWITSLVTELGEDCAELSPEYSAPTMWINYMVACSNLVFGLPVCWYARTDAQLLVALFMILASVLMHLSETKHRLPGIYPWNQYTWYFLQFDRVMALLCSGYVLSYLLWRPYATHWTIGLAGLACNVVSELVHDSWYVITHCVWHACAYYLLYLTFRQL